MSFFKIGMSFLEFFIEFREFIVELLDLRGRLSLLVSEVALEFRL